VRYFDVTQSLLATEEHTSNITNNNISYESNFFNTANYIQLQKDTLRNS